MKTPARVRRTPKQVAQWAEVVERMNTAGKADEIAVTLTERGKRYGDFTDNARISQNIKHQFWSHPNWHKLSAVQKETLEMIAQKIARVLNGDPDYPDNWHDIAGYAKLAEDRCQGEASNE